MRTNTDFNKIAIETGNRSRSRFGLAHEVDTTAGFGDCQPLQVRLLVPNSKTVASVESLVRCAPMVVPTAGKIKLKTWSHFVGMSDLLRSWSAFLTGKPYGSAAGVRVQSKVPTMRLKDLSCMVLIGSHVTIYERTLGTDADSNLTEWSTYDSKTQTSIGLMNDILTAIDPSVMMATNLTDARFPLYSGTMVSLSLFGADLPSLMVPINNSMPAQASGVWTALDWFHYNGSQAFSGLSLNEDIVELDSADYILVRKFGSGQNEKELAFAVRLSAFGKRLRKILIACGYQVNFASAAEVNILPLFAYYKAYFDTFGLCLYQNYESTDADVLLKQYDAGSSNFNWGNVNWCRFIYDLGSCFVTDTQDFISAHQRTDAVSSNSLGFVNNIVLAPNYSGQQLDDAMNQVNNPQLLPVANQPTTNHVYIDRVNHTEVDSELLKLLYKWTNRNTVAGQRIAELLRAGGYGKYVDEQKSNFIGYTELAIDVMDVNATADTFDSVGERASVTGEPAGKGFGYDKKAANTKFSFENDEFGYWITLCAVVPNSGYCQGIDPVLYDTERTDFYAAEFDGKGMEFSRNSVVFGTTDWHVDGSSNDAHFDESFGLVPRLSRYKVAHDVLNGDFSLRGVRAGYLPYTLNKFLTAGERRIFTDATYDPAQGCYRYKADNGMQVKNLPIAGNAWRYNSRYPWLNNFERIFVNFLKNQRFANNDFATVGSITSYEFLANYYDSFIIHNVVDMQTYAPMLPIEDSYGTTDDNDGRSDTTFTKA